MKTENKIRNWNAVAAHQRNSAGPMKDKRQARHYIKNQSIMQLLEEEDMAYEEEDMAYQDND